MDARNADRMRWLIESRHSARGAFNPDRRVTEIELAHLVEAARWAPTADNLQNFQLAVIDEPAVLAVLGAIPAGDAARDGRRTLGELIAGAPMVMVVVFDPTACAPASDCDALGAISLGCVLENLWLEAHSLQLDLQVMSAFSAAGVAPEVARVLGVPPPWLVAYALRLGHALSAAHPPRVRRAPEDFVHRNGFRR